MPNTRRRTCRKGQRQYSEFSPVEIRDSDGLAHIFHFRTNDFGFGIALNGFEVRGGEPSGYEFQVIGEPDADLPDLLANLIGKIRRALALKHIVKGDLGPCIADHQIVRGRIGCDLTEEEHTPLLVIDGREFTWSEFGRMIMTFEDCQFKLEIRDKSEEV